MTSSACVTPTPSEQTAVNNFDSPVLPPPIQPRSRLAGRQPLLVKVTDPGHASWSLAARALDAETEQRFFYAALMQDDGRLLVFSTHVADKDAPINYGRRNNPGLLVEVNAVKFENSIYEEERLYREKFSAEDEPGSGLYPSFTETEAGPVLNYVYDYDFFDHDEDEQQRQAFDAKYARAAVRPVAPVKAPLSSVNLALPTKSFPHMCLNRVVQTPDGLRILKTHQTGCCPMTDLQGQSVGVFARPADMLHGWVVAFAVDSHGRYHLLVSHPLWGTPPQGKPNLYSMLVFGPDFKPLGRWAVDATRKTYHSAGLCIDDAGNCVVYFNYGGHPCKSKLIVFTPFGQRITEVACPERKYVNFKQLSLCPDGDVLVLHSDCAFKARLADLQHV
jgi:hypothetical protein